MAVIRAASCVSVAELAMVRGGEGEPTPLPCASWPGGCAKGPGPQTSWSRICISSELPGDADAGGRGTPGGEALCSRLSRAPQPGLTWESAGSCPDCARGREKPVRWSPRGHSMPFLSVAQNLLFKDGDRRKSIPSTDPAILKATAGGAILGRGERPETRRTGADLIGTRVPAPSAWALLTRAPRG